MTTLISITEFCAAAREAGFAVLPKVGGGVIAERGSQTLVATCADDGSITVSGKGSYVALSEMFPDK